MFDRQIRNTAPGIELIRCNDSGRGADLNAAIAGAAVISGLRFAKRQGQISEDFSQEKK